MAKKTTSTKKTSASGATGKQTRSSKSSSSAKKKTGQRKTSAAATAAAGKAARPSTAKPASAAKVPDPAAAKAPTVSTRGSANSRTTLSAKVDIGFGNTLYIRGEGAELSWNRGVPMDCVDADEWVWSSDSAPGPVVCKVLINDEIWSTGEDFRVPRGERLVCYPAF